MKPMHAMQADTPDKGKLKIQINSEITSFPIADASISISYTGVPEQTLEQVTTDSSGQTETLELAAPPLEYSLNPTIESQPYSEYTLSVTAPGFEPINISGTEILPDVTAIQNITMRPSTATPQQEVFVIPAHTLYGTYPPKIAEDEIKPTDETGEIVLSRVVVPEFIVVHAIMSFTLNRVYTEWYRNKGYDFTITSSTAFDHKWIPERNIYDTISVIVDELFANYLSRPNVRQPILTQYCDGRQVSCPNWMTI